MKKKTTSNPLKTFNDNTANAYKKGGIAMKAFKKSLPKAQFGTVAPASSTNVVNPYKNNFPDLKSKKRVISPGKDDWGRSESSKWYGFDPDRKKFVTGPKTDEALKKILSSPNAKIAIPDPDPDRSIQDSIRYDRGSMTSFGIPYTKDYPGVKGVSRTYPGDKDVIKGAQQGKLRIYNDKKKGGVVKKKKK